MDHGELHANDTMVLFTGNILNYITRSQLVLGSGYFASSPAQLKSIAVTPGEDLTITDLQLSFTGPAHVGKSPNQHCLSGDCAESELLLGAES